MTTMLIVYHGHSPHTTALYNNKQIQTHSSQQSFVFHEQKEISMTTQITVYFNQLS
jgi:hypothetical protein